MVIQDIMSLECIYNEARSYLQEDVREESAI